MLGCSSRGPSGRSTGSSVGRPRQSARRSRADATRSTPSSPIAGACSSERGRSGGWPGGIATGPMAADLGRLGDSTEVMDLNVYNGTLYAATIPRAEVFRYERDGVVDEPPTVLRPAGLAARPRRRHAPPARRRPTDARVVADHEPDRARWPAVRLDRQLHQRRDRCACRRPRFRPGARASGSSRRRRARSSRAGTTSRRGRWGNRVSIHVDGREVATAQGQLPGPPTTSAPLRIGEDETGPYRGGLAGFRIEQRPLDDREIAALAASSRPPAVTTRATADPCDRADRARRGRCHGDDRARRGRDARSRCASAARELLVAATRPATRPCPTFGSFLMAPWVGELVRWAASSSAGGRPRSRRTMAATPSTAWSPPAPWEVDEADARPRRRLTRRLGPPWPFGGTVTQEHPARRRRHHARGRDPRGGRGHARRARVAPLVRLPGSRAACACGVQADRCSSSTTSSSRRAGSCPSAATRTSAAAPILGGRQIDTVFVGAVSPATIHLRATSSSSSTSTRRSTPSSSTRRRARSASSRGRRGRTRSASPETGHPDRRRGPRARRDPSSGWTRWAWSSHDPGMDNGGRAARTIQPAAFAH